MTFYIQKVKGELQCDIIMFCKNTFLAVIQHHYSGREEENCDYISHLVSFSVLSESALSALSAN